MTRVLVVSDSHGEAGRLRWILEHEKADALIYLGDGLRDLDDVRDSKRPGLRIYQVRGNCDWGYSSDPSMGLCAFDGVLCFYTHGHMFGAKSGTWQLEEAGESRGADVVLFGHTHMPTLEHADDARHPTLFNPGSLGFGSSYGVLECDEGRVKCLFFRVPAAACE